MRMLEILLKNLLMIFKKSEKVLSIAKKKGKEIEKKANELYDLAVEKGTPVLEKAASDVRKKTIEVLNDTVAKLEKAENKAK